MERVEDGKDVGGVSIDRKPQNKPVPGAMIKEVALAGVAQWMEHWPGNPGSPVRFPVRAHAWVVSQVPSRGHMRGNHKFLSLSFSLPLCKIYKN